MHAFISGNPGCVPLARLNFVVAYILCSIHYFFHLTFKWCSCIQIKHCPMLCTCHNIDAGPAVSIFILSNLCEDTLSYRYFEHCTISESGRESYHTAKLHTSTIDDRACKSPTCFPHASASSSAILNETTLMSLDSEH